MQAICDDLLQKQSASGRQIISIPLKQPKQRHNNPDNPVGADKALMTKPELFDVIELLVDLPESVYHIPNSLHLRLFLRK